jgi:hypothetical protein
MSLISHFVNRGRTFWCGVVVFVAISGLTVHLATRYSGPWGNSPSTVKALHSYITPQAKGQRLAKDGLSWLPPIFRLTALRAPIFHAESGAACPEVRNLFLERSLYNRPPPSI